MKFEAHGDFEITVKGEVFIIKFCHKWNLEGAKFFFTKYKECVKQHNFKNYGVLSDLRPFEGGTPEAIDFFEVVGDWAKENGQIARALIMDSSIKELTMVAINKGKERFPAQVFHSEKEALQWFKNFGLNIS
ncbi:MAG: hypothetical protein HUN04_11825 [Desulfobacter sp.]|nr:MAG: hypothetical protein HUN04_07495 [Desulfobacter sp.]WDP90346.1 MAG: hypothetical protein HUN04_11825 [Desulfobacter sp.]